MPSKKVPGIRRRQSSGIGNQTNVQINVKADVRSRATIAIIWGPAGLKSSKTAFQRKREPRV